MSTITLKSLIMSFTKAIDLYNYLLKNHHRRTAVAAYQIGRAYGLDDQGISNLVISAALHDIGALTVIERDQLVVMDVEDPYPHCGLGSYMLESFEPLHQISNIIYYHHWPYSRDNDWIPEKGTVPVEAYILHVADRVDILVDHKEAILTQKKTVTEKIMSYSGTLFYPKVTEAFCEVAEMDSFWLDIDNLTMDTVLEMAVSTDYEINMTLDLLEQFAFTISKIIDSRSRFTISHSFGVSEVSYKLSSLAGYPEDKCRKMRVAGLLHDIGKIAISSEIVEKNGQLTEKERTDVQAHAYFTGLILRSIHGLEEIVDWAASHHENHDGSGYPMNLRENRISEEMDIVSYADIYTALSENRPYRESLPSQKIMKIMEQQFEEKHGSKIYKILVANIDSVDRVCKEAIRDGGNRFQIYQEMAEKYAHV